MQSNRKLRTPAGVALIVLATCAAYAPVFRAGFIWNDSDYVTAPALRSLSGLARIWFKIGATEQYYPLLHSAFWAEHRLWGDAPIGYHLLNVALHAISAVLVLLVLRRLAIPGAWLASFVFALHPVCVESVAWVSEQKNTLSTVFYLLAALSYLRFDDRRSPGRYALASVFFVLALLSKTVTATLPAALLVLAWWRRGTLSWRRDVAPLLPWLVFGGAAGLFSGWVEKHVGGAEGSAFALNGLERLLLASRAAWFYAGKLVWPANLIFIYPRWAVTGASLGAWGFLIAVAAAFAVLAALRGRNRAPLAGALFFVGTLFPTLGFFNVYAFIYSYVADHWQYLASLGLIVPVCAGLAWAARGLAPPVRVAAGAGLAACLAFLTWRQAGMYGDMETFYRTTLERNPAAWMADNNLAMLLQARGRTAEAISRFEAALRSNPDSAEIHNNYGTALAAAGRFGDADREYRTALRLNPRYSTAWNNLGLLLYQTGRRPEALAAYAESIRLKPDYTPAHYNLGVALLDSGQPEKAVGEFEKALGAEQHRGEVHLYLGDALADLKRNREAAEQYAVAARLLEPGDCTGWLGLGDSLVRQGQFAPAAAAFSEAAKAEPNNPKPMFDLGNAFAAQEQYAAAAQAYRRAIALAPDLADAHNNLGNVLLLTGQVAAAVAEYREALRERPGDAALQESLRRALEMQDGGARTP
ncbi:MAG: tetratricopeptide repeat protein [Opitutaceae bacterium]|jgi:tetratricopeptide (TPR) repeat protein